MGVAEEVIMGILDEIRDAQKKPLGRCAFALFMDTLPAEDQAGLQTALTEEDITTKAIFVAIRKHGFQNGETVVRKHRRGDCSCR